MNISTKTTLNLTLNRLNKRKNFSLVFVSDFSKLVISTPPTQPKKHFSSLPQSCGYSKSHKHLIKNILLLIQYL